MGGTKAERDAIFIRGRGYGAILIEGDAILINKGCINGWGRM